MPLIGNGCERVTILGRLGMSTRHVVYSVQRGNGTRAVLKIATKNSDELRKEAEVLLYLEGRGVTRVPRVLFHGRVRGAACLLLSGVGTPISDAVSTRSGQQQAGRWLREIGKVLNSVHQANVVHSDVKPDHIIITDGEAHLIDFGLSVLIGEVYRGGTEKYFSKAKQQFASRACPADDLHALHKTEADVLGCAETKQAEALLGHIGRNHAH